MKTGQVKTVLIIANGEPPENAILELLAGISDCIIAANGGCNICYQKYIHPHFIVGDLDSIESKLLSHFKDSEIIRLEDHNVHDLEKAILFAHTLKPDIIRVVAAFGKRLDHTLANLTLLQPVIVETPIEFYDNYGKLTVIRGEHSLNLPIGRTVSLFSFLPVQGLTLTGFEYPIKNKEFKDGFSGLSNVVSSEKAKVSIKKGSLFLYIMNEIT